MVEISGRKVKIIEVYDERIDDEGMVSSVAKDPEFYPGIETKVISPAYYYEKKYNDKYSLQILDAKNRIDLSHLFLESVEGVLDKYGGEMGINECNFITIIPTSKSDMPMSTTIFSLATRLSEKLKIPFSPILEKIEYKAIIGKRSRQKIYNAIKDTIIVKRNVSGKRILLLDDLRASGIHILECSKVLIDAGAIGVVCICLGTHTSNPPPENEKGEKE